MATIRAFVERFKNFDVKETAMDTFLDLRAHVIDKNLDQLQEGLDANGNRFKKYAWDDYADYKHELNPKAGHGNPDLKLTGDFWSSFVLEQTNGTEYEIKSTDSKASKLESHYSDNEIYGLSKKSAEEFVEQKYRSAFTKAVKDKLQLP